MTAQSVTIHESLIHQRALREYLYGDRAHFTAKSLSTGRHYTYKLNKVYPIDRTLPPYHMVELLIGNDNKSDYRVLGEIHDHGRVKRFWFTPDPDNILSQWSRSVKAIKFVVYHAYARRCCPSLQIWKESSCDYCGRLLTHPTSIFKRRGPICCQFS